MAAASSFLDRTDVMMQDLLVLIPRNARLLTEMGSLKCPGAAASVLTTRREAARTWFKKGLL